MIVFETQRLQVRLWQPDDFAVLYAMLSDPITMAHWPAPLEPEAVRAWLARSAADMSQHGHARWCMQLREGATVVGDIGIARRAHAGAWVNDLGCIVHHPYWHQGIGFEAANGAIGWAQDKGLDGLVANMAVDNAASVGLATKLGMRRTATINNPANRDKPTHWFSLDLSADRR